MPRKPTGKPLTTALFRRRLAIFAGALSHLEEARTEKKRGEYTMIALATAHTMVATALRKSGARVRLAELAPPRPPSPTRPRP